MRVGRGGRVLGARFRSGYSRTRRRRVEAIKALPPVISAVNKTALSNLIGRQPDAGGDGMSWYRSGGRELVGKGNPMQIGGCPTGSLNGCQRSQTPRHTQTH